MRAKIKHFLSRSVELFQILFTLSPEIRVVIRRIHEENVAKYPHQI